MDNKDTFIWTDALVQEFAVKECNSGNDDRFDVRIKHFKESKKEQLVKDKIKVTGIYKDEHDAIPKSIDTYKSSPMFNDFKNLAKQKINQCKT